MSIESKIAMLEGGASSDDTGKVACFTWATTRHKMPNRKTSKAVKAKIVLFLRLLFRSKSIGGEHVDENFLTDVGIDFKGFRIA